MEVKYVKIFTLLLLTSVLIFPLFGSQNQTESNLQRVTDFHTPYIVYPINTTTGHWKMVWEDTFDDLDTSQKKWNFIKNEKNYNNELESYLPENATISDGLLHLTAKQDNGHYTSGKLTTQNKFSFQYGRVEVRAKYPPGKGLFPAIWMLPKDTTKTLPEIDLFEVVGDDPHTIYSVIHTGTIGRVRSYHSVYQVNPTNTFHIYAMEWTKKELRFYLDNQLYFKSHIAIPQESMYLILNFAVGGI